MTRFNPKGWGGHSHWKVVRGCAALKTSFFRPHFSSRNPPFQALFQLQRPHFQFLKNLAFQDQFLLILTKLLAPETQLLATFYSGDPSFKQKNKFRRPYFWKPGQYTPTQIFVDKSPPRFNYIGSNVVPYPTWWARRAHQVRKSKISSKSFQPCKSKWPALITFNGHNLILYVMLMQMKNLLKLNIFNAAMGVLRAYQ